MNQFEENLAKGKIYEQKVKSFLIKSGYSVEEYICYDESGNECPQWYVYIDGSEENPHPDFTVTINNNFIYIEVKSFTSFYYCNGSHLFIRKRAFDSYLKLSRWKNIPGKIVFIIHKEDRNFEEWYIQDFEILDSAKMNNNYDKESYFWNVKSLKLLKR